MGGLSTRLRLLVMALGLIVPALTFIVYDQTVERGRAQQRAVDDTFRLARLVATQHTAMFEGAQRLLLTLARVPDLRASDPAACNALLPDVLRDHPGYLNIWVTNADRSLFCAALPDRPSSIPDRVWFERAVRTRRPTVGGYQTSILTGKPDVVLAQPLLGASGQVERVISAALDLNQLNAVLSRAPIPPGATLTLTDASHTILAHYPDPDLWTGKRMPDTWADKSARPDPRHLVDAVGLDGVRRFYAVAPVDLKLDTRISVVMGVPPAALFARANNLLLRHLVVLGLVAFITLAAALVGGQWFVLQPIEALRMVMNRLAMGDFGARTELVAGAPGLRDLGSAVDAMATALETRQRERDQAETQRRLLASIVEDCDDAILCFTLDGVIVSWNLGAEMLFGYSPEEIVGQPVSLIVPIERIQESSDLLAGLRLGTRLKNYDTVRQRKDGSRVPVSLTLFPMRDASGQITLGSAIVRDMSERHMAEQTLRTSEERFRRITETIAEVFWMADVEIHTMVYISPAYERIWGRTCESLYQNPRSFLDAIHPEDRTRVLNALTVKNAGQPFDHEYRIVRPDGSVRWIWDRGFPVPNPDGPVTEYVGAAQDITERLAAERALHETERKMHFALSASRVGIWEADLKSGVSYWSETCEEMHGLAKGTFGGTPDAFIARVYGDDREQVLKTIDEATRKGGPASFEYRTTRPDGTIRLIQATGDFFCDETGAAVRAAGVAIDVTDQRSLEEQLRHAQKMEAVGRLAGGIAHDFNNVLTAILGYAEFVLGDLPSHDRHRRDIEEIAKAGRRAALLTQQLLAFGRKQILAPRVLHLGDVVGDVAPMLRRLLGETIDLRTSMSDRGSVKADAGQVEQVLVNLAVNARDAMPEGGRLTIETMDVLLDEAYTRQYPAVRPGPYVVAMVSDTGHGMDAATQKHVFEPFFTTKPRGQGTGLGLATVYGIVKQSGGHLSMVSEVGRGTTLKVYLPRTDEVDQVVQPPVDLPAGQGRETILVVEDEDAVRECVGRVLSRLGYTVQAMASPNQAIAFAGAYQASIHMILADVVLPEMSGRTMVTRLQARHPESKVLYVSGHTDDEIVHQGVLDPETWFLQKPFTGETLGRKVRDVLDAQA